MAGADKRAKLLSELMAAKGAAASTASWPAEGERISVIQMAERHVGEERAAEPAVLYSKGAATASTFRPSYWSFDHGAAPEPAAVPAVAGAPPAPSAPVLPLPTRSLRPASAGLVVGFGCLALVVSTSLLVLSLGQRGAGPAAPPEPVQISATPAAAVAPPVMPQPQEAPPALAVAAEPAAAPPAAAPAPIDPPPAAASTPVEEPAIEPTAVAAAPAPSPPSEADALLARGDDLLMTGDVAAARLFYERAAEQGSAAAATAVGQTYDPGVLEVLRVRGARGDPQAAAEWYRKALAAGDRQAEIRLKRLLARSPG
jgi:hypothetical protein